MAFVDKKESGLKTIVKGFVTGGTQACITYPPEYVKTQLQLQSRTNPQFKGMIDCFTWTWKNHGPTGLYRGASVRIFGAGAQQMCRWGAYTNLSAMFENPNAGTRALCGIGAGICEALIAVTPVETIKTRVTDDLRKGEGKYTGSVDATMKIIRSEGPMGIYRGALPTCLKQGTNQAVRMPLQVMVFDVMSRGDKSLKSNPIYNGVAGTVAGFISVILTQPQDNVKTRMQGEGAKLYKGTVDCFLQVLKNEGPVQLFAGTVPRGVQVGMTTGCSFAIYPLVTRALNWAWEGGASATKAPPEEIKKKTSNAELFRKKSWSKKTGDATTIS